MEVKISSLKHWKFGMISDKVEGWLGRYLGS